MGLTESASELWELSAGELSRGYRARDLSPVEVLDALAGRIERLSPELGAFTTLCLERAREEARAAERLLGSGQDVLRLTGVPFAAKDVFDTAGVRTTYGSPMFAAHVPVSDASAVAGVRAQGGILIGKTQTHEFAWGLTSVNEAMGTTRNPWDVELITGGSSGGSAAALAAQLVPLALGSDTGGSIRLPSAFCGTLGFKPTFGRIETAGMWPLAPSLDHAGPMARTAGDLKSLFSVLDSGGGARRPVPVEDLCIVICPELHLASMSRAVEECYARTITVLEDLGARIVERSVPSAGEIVQAFTVIQAVETVQVHRDAGLFPAEAAHYGPDVRARLEAGLTQGSRAQLSARQARERIRADFLRLLEDDAYLLTPIAAVSAPTIRSELTRDENGIDFRSQVLPYTAPQDLLGLPSCAVRCGFDYAGHPIGLQFTAAPWRDWELLSLVERWFDATPQVQSPWPLAGATTPSAPGSSEALIPGGS